ncbi:MAG: hypothetical protein Q7N50_04860, partial [Armatimonadota bacterium]|nr:hypothetical protein [Armatimonadota bacterium]
MRGKLAICAVIVIALGLVAWWLGGRESRAFSVACKAGNIAAFATFAERHPDTKLATQAENRAYRCACNEHTIQAYKEFSHRFPKSDLLPRVNDAIGDCLYETTASSWSRTELEAFLKNYPESKHVSEARDLLKDFAAAERFFRSGGKIYIIPGSVTDSVRPHAEEFSMRCISRDKKERTVLFALGYPLEKGGRSWTVDCQEKGTVGPQQVNELSYSNPKPGFGKYWPESGELREGKLLVRLEDAETWKALSNEVGISYAYQ